MLSGASMNWIADFITDSSILWSLETLHIDDLIFTGTNPIWNEVLIIQAERSPAKFRQLLVADEALRQLFAEAVYSPEPILVREEGGRLRILDGSHRVVAAVVRGDNTIQGYVARVQGQPKPHVEAHVVYDLLKAHHRGLTQDRAGLVHALKYLRSAYSNVDSLLRERFQINWVPSHEIQSIITEALTDSHT